MGKRGLCVSGDGRDGRSLYRGKRAGRARVLLGRTAGSLAMAGRVRTDGEKLFTVFFFF